MKDIDQHSGSSSQLVYKISYAGGFAALIFLTTFILHIPIGINGGYIHLGDAFIYLAASILPMPYAMAAGAVGAGLSDFMSPGGIMWLLPTIIIKPLCCLAFTSKNRKIIGVRNIAAIIISGAVTVIGYFIASMIITGSIAVPIAELPMSFIQPAGSGIFYIMLGFALNKMDIRKYIFK